MALTYDTKQVVEQELKLMSDERVRNLAANAVAIDAQVSIVEQPELWRLVFNARFMIERESALRGLDRPAEMTPVERYTADLELCRRLYDEAQHATEFAIDVFIRRKGRLDQDQIHKPAIKYFWPSYTGEAVAIVQRGVVMADRAPVKEFVTAMRRDLRARLLAEREALIERYNERGIGKPLPAIPDFGLEDEQAADVPAEPQLSSAEIDAAMSANAASDLREKGLSSDYYGLRYAAMKYRESKHGA